LSLFPSFSALQKAEQADRERQERARQVSATYIHLLLSIWSSYGLFLIRFLRSQREDRAKQEAEQRRLVAQQRIQVRPLFP
jgi:hypothetical protein